MKIKAGTKLRVFHRRHGAFNGIASKDFNTEEDKFYPIVLDDDCVEGLSTTFYKGDNMPCRNIFCEIEIVKDINMEEFMKKILLVIALISMCCGCSCGNKELFDTTYTYDKAICSIAGEWKKIKIKKWTDYEGEQIQIWDKEDNYYLVSSVNCTLMKESD